MKIYLFSLFSCYFSWSWFCTWRQSFVTDIICSICPVRSASLPINLRLIPLFHWAFYSSDRRLFLNSLNRIYSASPSIRSEATELISLFFTPQTLPIYLPSELDRGVSVDGRLRSNLNQQTSCGRWGHRTDRTARITPLFSCKCM